MNETAGHLVTCGPITSPVITGLPQPPQALVCPVTGEIVNTTDPDALIDALETARVHEAAMTHFKRQLSFALVCLMPADSDAKTRRVRGSRRRAKITMPDDSWDNSTLKTAWNDYPHLREQYLRIGRIDVQLREYKKLVNESGPQDFEAFKKIILSANRGPTATPTITIEEG